MAMATFGGLGMELQECLDELAQAVVHPLKEGLHPFNNVMKMLLCMETDPYGQITRGYSKIRNEIVNMDRYMKMAQDVALDWLERIDESTVDLTNELTELTNQKTEHENELGNLNLTLQSHRSTYGMYKNSLEMEKRSQKSAKDTLKSMKTRKERGTAFAVLGGVVGVAGCLVFPPAALIAGGSLAAVGVVETVEASKAMDKAQNEVQRYESQIKIYSDKVSKYKSEVSREKDNIKKVDEMICTVEDKLQETCEVRSVIADIQGHLRGATIQLEQLCNVSSAAELHTRYVVMVEPLVKVTKNMITALGQITTTDLLYSKGIPSLMEEIQSNHSRLVQQQQNSITFDSEFKDY